MDNHGSDASGVADDVQESGGEEELVAPEEPVSGEPNIAVDPIVNWEEYLQGLGLRHESKPKHMQYLTIDGSIPVGVIDFMGKSTSNIRARCQIHSKCTCWVYPKTHVPQDQILKDLIEWLNMGRQCDAADHSEWSREVRLMYGHELRS